MIVCEGFLAKAKQYKFAEPSTPGASLRWSLRAAEEITRYAHHISQRHVCFANPA